MGEDGNVDSVFKAHRRALIEYAVSFVGREFAEDIVQEAYLKLLELQKDNRNWTIGPRGEIRNLKSYIYAVVRNLCHDRHRGVARDRARYSSEDVLDTIASIDPSPEETVLVRQQLEQMARAIDNLPSRTGTAFRMSWCDGVPLRLIAEELQVSIQRADQLVRQAETYLARDLPDFKPRCK